MAHNDAPQSKVVKLTQGEDMKGDYLHTGLLKTKKKKYYGVAFGRKLGVFDMDWCHCKYLVQKFQGARFKGFDNPADAWKHIINLNKEIKFPNSLSETTKLDGDEIERYQLECQTHMKMNDETIGNGRSVAGSKGRTLQKKLQFLHKFHVYIILPYIPVFIKLHISSFLNFEAMIKY